MTGSAASVTLTVCALPPTSADIDDATVADVENDVVALYCLKPERRR